MYLAKRKGRARHEVFRAPGGNADQPEPDDEEPAATEPSTSEPSTPDSFDDDPAAEGSADRRGAGGPGDGGGDLDRGGARGGARGGPSLQDEPDDPDAATRTPRPTDFDEAEAVALDEPAEAADEEEARSEPVTITDEEHEQPGAGEPGPAGRAPRRGCRRAHRGAPPPAPALPAPPLARSARLALERERGADPLHHRRVRRRTGTGTAPGGSGSVRFTRASLRSMAMNCPRLAGQLAASRRPRRPRPRATAGSTRPRPRTRPAPARARTPAARPPCPGRVPARALHLRVSSITTSIAAGATIATHSIPRSTSRCFTCPSSCATTSRT